ncbi:MULTISPECIES: ribonuclease E inhibitor RraB [Xanthomonas]|uniref:ribonuclease E inhibitor RraB n=1 Tax=Xanthomonas TaxID=338 RepID=UPI0006FF07D7|nr:MULTISPECIES: ribonuclease E inhibitor RraB [Xanthomonas]
MSWPDDADGDVFRRLEADGFDFSKPYAVDYNVDFESWPPAPLALEVLRSQYGGIEVIEPDEDGDGYVLFQVIGPVTYAGVISVQRRTSSTMQPFGGICESWGVMH